MKVEINQEECIGCGSCAAVCPKVFEINDEGKAQIKDSHDPVACQTEESCVQEAADICPVEVIKIHQEK